ncbi:hypothetical protein BKA69DRAFT_1127000 [Paraphysoderma sedebokerense]|nr:hypothetical protein BKA69DRAFT_1127000 [Paraphysoderma sedebokerense]
MPTQKPNFNIDFNGVTTSTTSSSFPLLTTLPTLPTLTLSSSHSIPQITIPISTQSVPPKPREYSITFRPSPSRVSSSGSTSRTMSRSNSGLQTVIPRSESCMSKELIQGCSDCNSDVPLSYLPVFYSLHRDIEDEGKTNGERLTDNLKRGVSREEPTNEIYMSMRQDIGFSNESEDLQILEPGLKDFIQQLQGHSSTLDSSIVRSGYSDTITTSKINQVYSGSEQPTNDDIFEYQLLRAWNSDPKINNHITSISFSETPLNTKTKPIESISPSQVPDCEERDNSLSGRPNWMTVAMERIKLVAGHFR